MNRVLINLDELASFLEEHGRPVEDAQCGYYSELLDEANRRVATMKNQELSNQVALRLMRTWLATPATERMPEARLRERIERELHASEPARVLSDEPRTTDRDVPTPTP